MPQYVSPSEPSNSKKGAASKVLKPEKWLLTREVLSGLQSHFWGKSVQSPVAVDCLAVLSPTDSAPGCLNEPAGISRSQFKVATQSIRIPGLPSYVQSQGGLVIDRVVAHAGGDKWWTTGAIRFKAQRIIQRRSEGVKVLADLSNYSLCANTKLTLGRRTSFKIRAELDPAGVTPVPKTLTPTSSPTPALQPSSTIKDVFHPRNASLSASLKSRMGPLILNVNAAANDRMMAGDEQRSRYYLVPVTTSVDIASKPGEHGPIVYRAGLFHVTAPHEVSVDPMTAWQLRPRLRTAVYAQAGAGLQGELTVWQGRRPVKPSSRLPQSTQPSLELPPNPLRALGQLPRILGSAEEGKVTRKKGSKSSFGSVEADRVTQAMGGVKGVMQQVGGDVSEWATWVARGGLKKTLMTKAERPAEPEVRPISAFLSPPHFKLGGMVGCVTRGTALSYMHPSPTRIPTIPGLDSVGYVPGAQPSLSLNQDDRKGSNAVELLKTLSKGGMASLQETVQIRPFATGVASVQFGSLQGLLLSFTRLTARAELGLTVPEEPVKGRAPHPAFSLDSRGAGAALTLSACQQLVGPVRILADARMALESTEPCPSLKNMFSSLVKAPKSGVAGSQGGDEGTAQVAPLSGLVKHVTGMRGRMVEVVAGVELLVPGTAGAARLLATYAPARKEAMLEVRLL